MKKIFNVSICLLILACAGKNIEKSDVHYKFGLAYLNTESYYRSLGEFEKALKYNPEDDRIYFGISTFYLKKEDLNNAEKNILKAISLNENNTTYFNTYASILAAKKNYEQASIYWKKVLKDPHYPSHAMIYYNLGYASYEIGKYNDAIHYLEKSLMEDESIIRTHMLLYRTYNQFGRYFDAESALKRALIINPLSATLKLELGKFYYKKGDYGEAAAHFNDIKETTNKSNPEYSEAIEYLKNMGLYNE